MSIAPEDEYSWQVEKEFVDSIRNKTPVRRTNFTSAVRYMEFAEAVRTSLQQERTIHLPFIR